MTSVAGNADAIVAWVRLRCAAWATTAGGIPRRPNANDLEAAAIVFSHPTGVVREGICSETTYAPLTAEVVEKIESEWVAARARRYAPVSDRPRGRRVLSPGVK